MTQHGVFLVTGLPATGKTTLARALATALAAPLLSKDAIKEPLLSVLGAQDAQASRRLSDASFAILFALAQQPLERLGTVVLEGNFRPGEHEPALQALLARGAQASCTQILCRAPEAVRQARLEARASAADRHPGHRDGEWVAAAALRGDAFLDLDGPRIIHDGAMFDPGSGSALIRSLANRHLV